MKPQISCQFTLKYVSLCQFHGYDSLILQCCDILVTHAAVLEKLSWSKNYPSIMEGSLPCSHQPTIGPYPVPDESTGISNIKFTKVEKLPDGVS
jgi:hypothetical protein